MVIALFAYINIHSLISHLILALICYCSGSRYNTQSPPVAYVWPITGVFLFTIFTNFEKRSRNQMIPYLKDLTQSVQNQERHWVWHHLDGGHALLTKKASLLLKFIWSVLRFVQFQNFFQTTDNRAFQLVQQKLQNTVIQNARSRLLI